MNGLRAEVQVRTVLQHAWAEIEHDELGYHSDDLVPADIRRRLARAAAVLEGVDAEFREIRRLAKKGALRPVRAEGLTEPLGEIEFSIDATILRGGQQESDLTLFFNVVITPTPGLENEPLLIVEDAAVSMPVRGDLIGANAVRFRGAFPKYVTDNLKYIRCRLRGIRVNANMLGVSASLSSPTKIVAAIVPNTDAIPPSPVILGQQDVAEVVPGLISRSFLRQNASSEEWVVIECEFAEGFAGAFKNPVEETAGDRLSKHGTRLRVEFPYVPEGMDLWVSTQNISRQPSDKASILAALIETDSSGSGEGASRASSRSISIGTTEGAVPVALAQRAGNTRYAVWEVSSDTTASLCLRRLTFLVFIARTGWIGFKLPCLTSFAPFSTITTVSGTAPIPRFADFGSRQTIVIENTAI